MLAGAVRNPRALSLAVMIAAFIAVVFWTQSRLPALDEKAQMGLRTDISSIAFDVVLPVSGDQRVLTRVFRSAVNWAYTNWKGMTFGLLFAAAALTILGNIRYRSSGNSWLDTLLGVVMGAPLGVCVNCATPVAHGLYCGGMRLESTLATLISSPTLNVIVLTMSFALLPFELALLKVASVFMILASIPLLVRRFASAKAFFTGGERILRESQQAQPAFSGQSTGPEGAFGGHQGWFDSSLSTLGSFLANLRWVLKLTLPLMLLAGFLGAFVVETVGFPAIPPGPQAFLLMLPLALVAVLLPVPIAFDVILVTGMISGGVDLGPAAVVLLALGSFSVYPAMVIGRYISWRLSAALFVLIVVIAWLGGVAASVYDDQKLARQGQVIQEALQQESLSSRSLRVAADTCMSLPQQLQFTCFSNFLRATPGLHAAGCEGLPAQLSAVCPVLVNFTDVQERALDAQDVSRCADIDDTGLREGCVFAVTTQSAQRSHDLSMCESLPTAQRDSCVSHYVDNAIRFSLAPSACDELGAPEKKKTCTVKLAIYRIVLDRDLPACSSLEDTLQQRTCQMLVSRERVKYDGDASHCEQPTFAAARAACLDEKSIYDAIAASDLTLCNEVIDPGRRRDCGLRVASQIITLQIDDYMIRRLAVPDREDNADSENLVAASAGAAPTIQWRLVYEDSNIRILESPFTPRSEASAARFVKRKGEEFGLREVWQLQPTDLFDPFVIGRGVAAGDLNGDDWPDLVFGSSDGLAIFLNRGGLFERSHFEIAELRGAQVFNVALFDSDNSGTPEILATTYGGRNYLIRVPLTASPEVVRLPGLQQLQTMAVAFGDLDANGLLDIFIGNWSSGTQKLFSAEHSENFLLYARVDGYELVRLDEPPGETLSALIADLNNDSLPDLMLANDRLVPDIVYLNDMDRGLRQVTPGDGLLPSTSLNTMSLAVGDFNNDLISDLFTADMSFDADGANDYCQAVQRSEEAHCRTLLRIFDALRGNDVHVCETVEDRALRRSCFRAMAVKAAARAHDPALCSIAADAGSALHSLCEHLASPLPPDPVIALVEYLPQQQRNTLMLGSVSGFTDATERAGVEGSYWSWNAQPADLDNDGWLDLFVGNGFEFGTQGREVHSNVAFQNLGDARFRRAEVEWGLEEFINTPSFVYVDFDRDGDLDIVAPGVMAGPRVFVNSSAEHNSVDIELIDHQANRQGIGSKVTIDYEGQSQMREFTLSGGFLSFNPPVAHFGLGRANSIDAITIRWSDGSESPIRQQFSGNRRYRVERMR